MKWLFAGLAFAAVVGLAVATAAIRAENVRQRALLQRLAEQRQSLQIELAAARAARAAETEPDLLIRRWAELRTRLEGGLR